MVNKGHSISSGEKTFTCPVVKFGDPCVHRRTDASHLKVSFCILLYTEPACSCARGAQTDLWASAGRHYPISKHKHCVKHAGYLCIHLDGSVYILVLTQVWAPLDNKAVWLLPSKTHMLKARRERVEGRRDTWPKKLACKKPQ